MIRYLEKEEFDRYLPLWREAFPEDSEQFLTYYYRKSRENSRILVKEDEQGNILTMAHLNFYRLRVAEREYELPYIVGVATASSARKKGYMREVMQQIFADLHRTYKPFCYLMPAQADIYTPFGFSYIFDQPGWKLRKDLPNAKHIPIRLDGIGGGWDPRKSAGWVGRFLDERYEVYAVRDGAYMEDLQAELDSQNGQAYAWEDESGELVALEGIWAGNKQRFLYCQRNDWMEIDETKRPAIMARITDLTAMAETITTTQNCPCLKMQVYLRVHDDLIPENDGLWRWKLDRESSRLLRVESLEAENLAVELPTPEEEQLDEAEKVGKDHLMNGGVLVSSEVLDITIDQFASWLFGYRALDEILELPPFWAHYVQPLRGVFLDEIV